MCSHLCVSHSPIRFLWFSRPTQFTRSHLWSPIVMSTSPPALTPRTTRRTPKVYTHLHTRNFNEWLWLRHIVEQQLGQIYILLLQLSSEEQLEEPGLWGWQEVWHTNSTPHVLLPADVCLWNNSVWGRKKIEGRRQWEKEDVVISWRFIAVKISFLESLTLWEHAHVHWFSASQSAPHCASLMSTNRKVQLLVRTQKWLHSGYVAVFISIAWW